MPKLPILWQAISCPSPQSYHHIPPSWPFACWSLDINGPFATAPGGFTHVLVAINKFTKWIEYKPITKLTPDRVVDFIFDILDRFGFPNTIIIDLGSNFTANQF
jgi:hypothetical protein